MINRKILSSLLTWKQDPLRKVLLLRGARQVGKTYIVKELGKTFEDYFEVNFLETPEISNFFTSGNLSPELIIEKLQSYFGKSITPGKTLLFFDEIQQCPTAISTLRFFHEKVPHLHVIAAGSLLEFALKDVSSFGVGRVTSLFMHPLCFSEFLTAVAGPQLTTLIHTYEKIDDVLHKKIIDHLTTYSIIGGLPEVIATYIRTKDINQCHAILDGLLIAYEDDFSKYQEKVHPQKLRDTLRSIAYQTGSKFSISRIKPQSSTYGYDIALSQLERAGLIYKQKRIAANGVPLGAEIDEKRYKYIPFDLGIYNRLVQLDISQIVLNSNIQLVHSGALAEILCGIEIIAETSPGQRTELFYWTRETKGSNAEVDFIIQKGNEIIPIEVKAGLRGQMQSLYIFMNEKHKRLGIRTSIENFSEFTAPQDIGNVKVIPLYAIGSWVHQQT